MLEYAVLLAARELFRHLHPERAVALGAGFGSAYARLRGPRTSDAAINLALAFPEERGGMKLYDVRHLLLVLPVLTGHSSRRRGRLLGSRRLLCS